LRMFRLRSREELLLTAERRTPVPRVEPSAKSTAARARIPDAHRLGCTSYHSGHGVHWIQALHTANKIEVSAKSWHGWIVSIEGELITVKRDGGDVVRFRNHDPIRLLAVLDVGSDEVLVNDQYAILRVGTYCFSVRRDKGVPLERCLTDQPPADLSDADLAARVESHGGFSVPLGRPRNVSGTRENDGLGGSQ
ncbi:MAG: hypothetical protein M3P04_14125, partial [Actinomycetota bacterium]|nr:hypothetical protein [Actinomycetota bacterium]